MLPGLSASPLLGGRRPRTVQFVGAANFGGTAASMSMTRPAGVENGDLLVAALAVNGAVTISTAPSGWFQRREANFGGGNNIRMFLYTKVASDEPASWSWLWNDGLTSKAAMVAAYRRHSNPDVVGNIAGSSASNAVTLPSLTPTKFGALVAFFAAPTPLGTLAQTPAEMVQSNIRSASTSLIGFHKLQSAAGATGTKTLARSSGTLSGIAGVMMQIGAAD